MTITPIGELHEGDTLRFRSHKPFPANGPIIRITEFQRSGDLVTGTVLDAGDSPYTVGLPFHGMTRYFETCDWPTKAEGPAPLGKRNSRRSSAAGMIAEGRTDDGEAR